MLGASLFPPVGLFLHCVVTMSLKELLMVPTVVCEQFSVTQTNVTGKKKKNGSDKLLIRHRTRAVFVADSILPTDERRTLHRIYNYLF